MSRFNLGSPIMMGLLIHGGMAPLAVLALKVLARANTPREKRNFFITYVIKSSHEVTSFPQ